MSYFIKLGDAVSQFLNVLIFNGDPNYSISGDAYRYNRKYLQAFIDLIFSPFEINHCYNAYQNDINKAKKLIAEGS